MPGTGSPVIGRASAAAAVRSTTRGAKATASRIDNSTRTAAETRVIMVGLAFALGRYGSHGEYSPITRVVAPYQRIALETLVVANPRSLHGPRPLQKSYRSASWITRAGALVATDEP